MTINRQLALGFGAVLAATSLTATVAIIMLQSTVVQKDDLARGLGERLARIEALRYRAEQLVATSRGYLITGDETYVARFEGASRLFRENLEQMEAGANPSDLGDVRAAWQDYVTVAERAAHRRSGSSDPASVLAYFEDVVKPSRDVLDDRIDRLVRGERVALTAAGERSRVAAHRAGATVAITSLLTLVIGAWLALATRRRLADQFERAQSATEQARRAVAARDEVLAVVSHDLRSSLTAIRLVTSPLRSRPPPDENLALRIGKIDLAAQRMNHLIDDLLETARAEAAGLELHCERCDLAPLISEACALVEEQAALKQIKLSSVAPHLEAFVDRERVSRVLSNLLGNAIKFTPRGGEVSTRLDREPGFVRVSVSDTGPGVSPDQLPRLFEKHWQASASRSRGLGLGLYIAKNLVEAHGGTIRADSVPGHGATFSFIVPTSADPSHARHRQGAGGGPRSLPPSLLEGGA
ncbi:MAG: hypothetical protein IPJ65_17255 [Archangiaceae bacterium]|nr:hypothetical protein [Archangiaceae bacterium]